MNALIRRRTMMKQTSGGGGGGVLPDGYQQVSYIYSDGSAYIDTGINGNHGIKIVANMGWHTLETRPLFGSRSSSTNRFLVTYYSGKIDFGYGSDKVTNVVPVAGTTYELTYGALDGADFYVDGDRANTTHQSTTVNTNATMYIFGAHYTYTSSVFSKSIFKSMTITNASNEVLFDGVPCYRTSDGVIGIYDLASDTFLTNQGGGSFSKGSDV